MFHATRLLIGGVGYYSPKNKAEHGPPVTPYTTIMPHFSLYVLKGLWGPNPLKIGIMLEALGADYEVKFVEFGSSDKETGVKGADYLNLCENGRTPTLVDHKRNDFVIWESGAILDYLCSAYDSENKFHGKTPEERAIVMQWLFFQVTGHSPVQGNLYFAKMFWKTAYGEDPTQVTLNRFKNELDRVFHVYEHRLQRQASLNGEDKAFLALDHPTIADYSALGWLGMLPDVAGKLEIDMQKYGILNKYIERMRNLPEAQAATRRVASGH